MTQNKEKLGWRGEEEEEEEKEKEKDRYIR